jgi:porphobilinogen synthase
MRELTAGVRLSHRAFIQPLFVEESIDRPRAINGLSQVEVDTADTILKRIETDMLAGAQKFLLFPVPESKQEHPRDFSFAASVVDRIKENFGNDIWLATDLCLCSYTTHGHCGILSEDRQQVLNHASVEVLTRYALQLAAAGADCIAPSDMMDGRIGAIRTQLDAMGQEQVSLMSYSAKFSSQFYGPFRDACHSAPAAGGLKDRKSYQLSPFNSNDALATALRDEAEGADILMVKPATLYLDVISRLRQQTSSPIAAYHVSGEYAAVESLAAQGLLKRMDAHIEIWAALQRSGADIIISYAARNARQWIEQATY